MTKPLFNKVAIVGVGLIGGSVGMALLRKAAARDVVGVVRRQKTAEEALRLKAVHRATASIEEGVADADMVVLCAPVDAIVQQMKRLKPHLKKSAIVIDVASSKSVVDAAAKRYLKNVRFVACHPMAGGAKIGVSHARADLFESSVCFVGQPDRLVESFWRLLGAKPVHLSPKLHDEWVARVSHLPHALSFALFLSAGVKRLTRFGIAAANPSIQDLARLSKSDPELWSGIFLSNRAEILKAVAEIEKSLRKIKKALHSKNTSELSRIIRSANANSQKLSPEIR